MQIDLSSCFWTLRYLDPDTQIPQAIPARVPGNVIGDLFRASKIPNPYFGHNTSQLRPFEYADWDYETTFKLTELVPEDENIELFLEGVDTLSEVFLNEVSLGKTANMFIAHHLAVPRETLRTGENHLRIHISSTLNAARDFDYPLGEQAIRYNFEGLHLRRPMHTYGWDIAPRIVGAGLWRPVTLRSLKPRRWTMTYLRTIALEETGALLLLDWAFALPRQERFEGYEAQLTMVCGMQRFVTRFPLRFLRGSQQFRLPDPQLWWPHGSGSQSLYECSLELRKDGETVDVTRWKTGVRMVKLERTDTLDEQGNGQFRFVVNGQPIFIRGSNWVPAEAVHGEHPERALKSLALWTDLGCNMVRCWGGGIYENDDFYDYCDCHGLLVWQDFMLACEFPPQNAKFLEVMREEVTAVVRRLRSHACLALWSGDNECDNVRFWGGMDRQPPSCNRVTREIIPQVLTCEDPGRDYLPSSPYICDVIWADGGDWDAPPEQHLWGPRNYWKSDHYTKHKAIFASEMGYHGMPDVESLKKFLPPESLQVQLSNVDWNCHAAQPFEELDGLYSYRIALMHHQIQNAFGETPERLEDFVEASQFVQAEAMKFFLESFRLGKPNKTGLIWWNVIDCWPQFSDSVVDYYYRKKPAYYYIKTSQQLVCLMCHEPKNGVVEVAVVNDRLTPVAGTYHVTELGDNGTLLDGRFRLEANTGAITLGAIPAKDYQVRPRFLLLEWMLDGEKEPCRNHYLLGKAPYSLATYRQWYEKLRIYLGFSL